MTNYHSARVANPGEFNSKSFRTIKLKKGITTIVGKKKVQTTLSNQTYRFDKQEFTAEQAKKWLEKNKINYISFEEAVEPNPNPNPNPNPKTETETKTETEDKVDFEGGSFGPEHVTKYKTGSNEIKRDKYPNTSPEQWDTGSNELNKQDMDKAITKEMGDHSSVYKKITKFYNDNNKMPSLKQFAMWIVESELEKDPKFYEKNKEE